MRRIRLGVAGLKDTKDLQGSIDLVVENGFGACEVQFVKEFTLKEKEATELGKIARDAGISLSVHAPYFAQLTTEEPDRLKLHLGALHHSSKLAQRMGATVVVTHPGTRGTTDTATLTERVNDNLAALGPRIVDTGIKLGLETCGRKSQFGVLGELAEVVRNHDFTTPVVDFAHVHAVMDGALKTAEAFNTIFAFITEHFTESHFSPLHCHFNDNEWGSAGEIRHVPYGKGDLRIGNLVEGAAGHDLSLTVISESKEASSHEAILKELEETGATMAGPGRERAQDSGSERIWLPDKVGLEARKDVHWFRKGSRELRITNWEKVLFPEDGYTKGDLISYYYNAAPLMVPFLADRLIVMQRVPDGIHGEAFYEKQAPKGRPDWVRTEPVGADKGKKTIDFVVAEDAITLMWLAQIASVEVHAWTSKWPNIDQPDLAVMDLDPHEPITFDDVRAVATHVKVVLDGLGLVAFPKTSGGSGLQIFIPLSEGHTYAEVREFCALVGQLIRSADPDRVTLQPSKAKRAGKVYIDANQNAQGKTLVAPYSVRPYVGATVSAPVTWDEVAEEFFPEQFTIATMFERLEAVGDPFRGIFSVKQDLHPALDQLRG